MNAILIDIFYRQQSISPAAWLLKDIANMDLNNCMVFCFSGSELAKVNFHFDLSINSQLNQFPLNKYQEKRAEYLKGKGQLFEMILQKTHYLLKKKNISKLFIFGNNFNLAKKIISLGFEVSNFELGPTRKPKPKFLIFGDGYNKWSQENIYGSLEADYSSEPDLHHLRHGEMPLQLAYDSSFFPESSFDSMFDFMRLAETLFSNNLNLSMRLKSHPGISSDKLAKVDHKNVFRGTQLKRKRFFLPQPKIDFIFTLSSSYALEQAINGKPYFHLHDSLLGKGICYKRLDKILLLKMVPKSLSLMQQTHAKKIYNSELSLHELKELFNT